jgi:hypothetical protein
MTHNLPFNMREFSLVSKLREGEIFNSQSKMVFLARHGLMQ